MIISLGEERAGLCASRVCLFWHIKFCPFSLPLGVRRWLRIVLVALPDLSINFFSISYKFILKNDMSEEDLVAIW